MSDINIKWKDPALYDMMHANSLAKGSRMKKYTFIRWSGKRTDPELRAIMRVLPEGQQPWVRCMIRTQKTCDVCGKDLKGQKGYRPITNAANKGNRLCPACISNAGK